MENILDGIQPLAAWRSAAHAIIWTAISWVVSLGTFYTLMLAFSLQENVVLMTLLSVSMASFAIVLPVSVASIGPFEGAVKVSGQAIGMSATTALSLGFLFHGVNILIYAMWGTIGMVMMGVSLGDVLNSHRDEQESMPSGAAASIK
jgi:uncharacterized membrane protein YbhN (UPF0104 family)